MTTRIDGHQVGGYLFKPVRLLDGHQVGGSVGPSDTGVIVGPGGTTVKVPLPPVPPKRVVTKNADGSVYETWAFAAQPLTGGPGSLVMRNAANQLDSKSMPGDVPRRVLLHLAADGIADEYEIEHNMGVPIVHVVVQDTVTLLGVPVASTDAVLASAGSKCVVKFASAPAAGLYLVSVIG